MQTKFLLKKNVRDYLKLRGWTQDKLAEKMGRSHRKQQVSNIMNRRIEPSMNFLHRFCETTHLGLEEVIETKFDGTISAPKRRNRVSFKE